MKPYLGAELQLSETEENINYILYVQQTQRKLPREAETNIRKQLLGLLPFALYKLLIRKQQ